MWRSSLYVTHYLHGDFTGTGIPETLNAIKQNILSSAFYRNGRKDIYKSFWALIKEKIVLNELRTYP